MLSYCGHMWNDQVLAVIYPAETEKLLKKLFAAEWARQHDNPFEAARQVEDQIGKAHFIATNWINDADVLAEVARLRAELGPMSHVPTKEQFAAEVYKSSKDCKTAGDKLSYLKFFAQVMGYVEKEGGVTINNNQWAVLSEPVTEEKWIEINGNG